VVWHNKLCVCTQYNPVGPRWAPFSVDCPTRRFTPYAVHQFSSNDSGGCFNSICCFSMECMSNAPNRNVLSTKLQSPEVDICNRQRCVADSTGRCNTCGKSLSQISQSMAGYTPIAVTAGSNPHRQLWLSNDVRPSTSIHRRLQRRELPSQQSVPVTKQPFTRRAFVSGAESITQE